MCFVYGGKGYTAQPGRNIFSQLIHKKTIYPLKRLSYRNDTPYNELTMNQLDGVYLCEYIW